MPAIEAAPRTESAVARRRMNQRDTTAEPTTCPVAGEAEGHQDAVDDRELPGLVHQPGARERGREDEDAGDRDRARAPRSTSCRRRTA